MCTLASLTYLSVTGPVVLPVISLLIGLKEKKKAEQTQKLARNQLIMIDMDYNDRDYIKAF